MAQPARIVCTLGPACSEASVLVRMAEAGMDVLRVNMAHADAAVLERARGLREEVERAVGRPLGLLVDLAGPKMRVGELPRPLVLADGETVILRAAETAEEGAIPVPTPALFPSLTPGTLVLLCDGLVVLEVVAADASSAECRVLSGGVVTSRRGVNVRGRLPGLPSLTGKDLADLQAALRIGADFIALSFVRSVRDVNDLRGRIPAGGPCLFTKLERPEALEDLGAIIDAADGVMVARGDLGVEMPIERVPMAQKRIIAACRAKGKPVITATQMLESMVEEPVPTRAEATDVVNAVLDGTDALMLSAETSVGRRPVEAVEMMARLAGEATGALSWGQRASAIGGEAGAVAGAACEAARSLGAAAIVCFTISGTTARLVSACRPLTPVLAATPLLSTARRLAILWGLSTCLVPEAATTDEMLDAAADAARAAGVPARSAIVVVAGVPPREPGITNLIRVMQV